MSDVHLVLPGMLVPRKPASRLYRQWANPQGKTIYVCVPNYGLGHIREVLIPVANELAGTVKFGSTVHAKGHSMGGFVAAIVAMIISLPEEDRSHMVDDVFGVALEGVAERRVPDAVWDAVDQVAALRLDCRSVSTVGTPWNGTTSAHPSWPLGRDLIVPGSHHFLPMRVVARVMAGRVPGAMCMMPGSRFLKILQKWVAELAAMPDGPAIYSLRTPIDGIVVPETASELRIPGVAMECVGGDHRPEGLAKDVEWIPGESDWFLTHLTQQFSSAIARRLNDHCGIAAPMPVAGLIPAPR